MFKGLRVQYSRVQVSKFTFCEGIWYLELSIWCFGTWNLELGIWNLELGTWNLELGPSIHLIGRASFREKRED